MSSLRLMWLVSRALRYLSLAVIVIITASGCPSPSPSPSPSGGSNVSSGSNAPSGGAPAQGGSTPVGTDSGQPDLGLSSGGGGGSGQTGLSVPVQAYANGSATTVPFTVNTTSLSVYYIYDCSSTGGSGFVADMISSSQASQNPDDQNIANESGSGGSATVTVNPQDVPGDYYLQVNSQCPWRIVVENG